MELTSASELPKTREYHTIEGELNGPVWFGMWSVGARENPLKTWLRSVQGNIYSKVGCIHQFNRAGSE